MRAGRRGAEGSAPGHGAEGLLCRAPRGLQVREQFLRIFDSFSIVSIRELIEIFLGMILSVIMICYHCLGNWISIYKLNCVVTRFWIYFRRVKLKAVRISQLRHTHHGEEIRASKSTW